MKQAQLTNFDTHGDVHRIRDCEFHLTIRHNYKHMKIKQFFFIALMLIVSLQLWAQTQDEQKPKLVTVHQTFGLSQLHVADHYLSPITYSGSGLSFEQSTHTLFKANRPKWSQMISVRAQGSVLYNAQGTSSMNFAQGSFSYGINYHLRPASQLMVLVGGFADVDVALKNISRNVNNPVNADLSTNLQAMATAIYRLQWGKRVVRLNLQCQAPLLGAMFVPQQGGTYYEMFSLMNLNNTIHFSTLHNKQGGRVAFYVDFDLKRSEWRVGINAENLVHTANNHYFERKSTTIFVGYNYHMHSFSGKRNAASGNYAKAIEWQ